MEAIVSLHFISENYEKPESERGSRFFILKFDVIPNERLVKIINGDDEFDNRLWEFFDDIDFFGEDWCTPNMDLFSWLNHFDPDSDDPFQMAKQIRDYLLSEGFSGGDLIEVSEQKIEEMKQTCKVQQSLLAELESLYPGSLNYR